MRKLGAGSKKITEGLIMAAQEEDNETRSIKHHIDKENMSPYAGYVEKETEQSPILYVNAHTWLRHNTGNGATIKLHRSSIGNSVKPMI